ncbi:A/G-specific adenine glycosylase [Patescibacteria group bacterium]|nr:A/G-specific adenine glycosylase [Patescibacteria group bacterium]
MNVKEKAFIEIVQSYYKKEGRHNLSWRKTKDPYKIIVSEVMLQQTQVARVQEKYKEFLALFPTVVSLGDATLVEVLKVWTGLGYNRRAKFLKSMAETITTEYKGKFPQTVEELEKLPGVGHYTARAIATFAYNQPQVFIETNIRTVYMYHFFPESEELVDDKVLLPIIEATLDTENPRVWYWALMDYGSYLKSQGIKIHRRSTQYVKQKPLKGSIREVRGAIIKVLAQGPQTVISLQKKLDFDVIRYETAITQLITENFIEKEKTFFKIKDSK